MRSIVRARGCRFLMAGAFALAGCADDHAGSTYDSGGAMSGSRGSDGAPAAQADASKGSSGDDGSSDSGVDASLAADADAGSAGDSSFAADADAGSADPCDGALLCEAFDDYAGLTAIADKQKFGPWRAALQAGATMGLDGVHTLSGSKALHVHIDNAVTSGGRLFSGGAGPSFAGNPTHVYGRMMMYIDPNGTSVHWTFFGVNGDAEPSSPAVGRNAQYILSSLPKNGVNTYSFVYGLAAQGGDGYHDCSSQSTRPMPSAWACIAFDLDSVARKLRMYKDGAAAPILSVDDHGSGCVAPTAVTSPWYGPAITQLFVGAWSFHPMNAPLDVWIDDLVVDTKKVACPPP